MSYYIAELTLITVKKKFLIQEQSSNLKAAYNRQEIHSNHYL